jgi:hypothetical protein
LDNFINYSIDNSVDLIVVVFPFLTDIDLSKELYTNKVVNYFRSKNIKTIDVGELVADLKVRKRVVNSNDAHPSVIVNRIVADEIVKIINTPKEKAITPETSDLN